MNKIYCPYVEGHSFDDLESAYNCYDCAYGCMLVENILRPVLENLTRHIEEIQKAEE